MVEAVSITGKFQTDVIAQFSNRSPTTQDGITQMSLLRRNCVKPRRVFTILERGKNMMERQEVEKKGRK